MEQGLTIHYSPEDLAELYEFIQWKTRKTASNFASVESNFDLKEANSLIKRAQLEKVQILKQIEAQRGQEEALGQQRQDISLLPDLAAERIEAEWREQARQQGEAYSKSKNRGATPRSTQDVDPSITESVLSWIKKQRLYSKKN